MNAFLRALTLAACFLTGQWTLAAGNAEQGKLLAQTCMGCHGAPGLRNAYPGYRVPKLGGQHDFYIVSALKAYQEETRWHPTMQAQAAGLDAEEMEHIAAYFASLGERREAGAAAGGIAAQCAACHGADGNSPATPAATQGAPIVAGQYADYVLQALLDYKEGTRQHAVMNGMAAGLDRAQMEEIADFYASQSGLAAPDIAE